MSRQGDFDATSVRDIYWNFQSRPAENVLADLAALLPAPVLRWLGEWMLTPHYASLQAEALMLRNYRQSWQPAPFPPVFVTVDALVLRHGHVLLIRRGHAPGRGLWALPGGFLEPRESLWQSCLRELREETSLALATSEADMRTALRGVLLFDHPERSLRGRTITHVHVFDLDALPAGPLPDAPGSEGEAHTTPELPAVLAGDDAAQAQWVSVQALAEMEEAFFEDHFHILRQCLGRFGGAAAPAPHTHTQSSVSLTPQELAQP